jgi:hypothetical protein
MVNNLTCELSQSTVHGVGVDSVGLAYFDIHPPHRQTQKKLADGIVGNFTKKKAGIKPLPRFLVVLR